MLFMQNCDIMLNVDIYAKKNPRCVFMPMLRLVQFNCTAIGGLHVGFTSSAGTWIPKYQE